MQWMIFSLFLLVICEFPVLRAKKVVVLMSRQVRRNHPSPLRNTMMMAQAKKTAFLGYGYPVQRYGYPPRPEYYAPKKLPFLKNQVPQGGDDFDQGHEEINNVIVPHGKGITHAVSFGNGYMPFQTYKDNPSAGSHHQKYKSDDQTAQRFHYGSPGNHPYGPSYSGAYISHQADAYLNNDHSSRDQLQDRIQGHGVQKYENGKYPRDASSADNIGTHNAVLQGLQGINPGVYVPPANLPVPLDNTKQGIVLRDSIVLDDYHRKIAELTKNWPSSLSGNFPAPQIGPLPQGAPQQNEVSRHFDGQNGLAGPAVGADYLPVFQPQNDGYAVKEDVVDTPHDFRTTPIQAAPVQTHQNLQQVFHQTSQAIYQQQQPLQQIVQQQQPNQQIIHQQPVQETLQQIYPQTQVLANYPQPNLQSYIHG